MKLSISSLKQQVIKPLLNLKNNNKTSLVKVNSFLLPKKNKVVFIMGATGTGKSRLAIDLATRFPAEIINSDKIQLYKGLNIVTNKVTSQETRGIPHHLLSIINSDAGTLTTSEFTYLATQAISKLSSNNKLPIIAGGSNSYIETLVKLNNFQCCFLWVDVSLPVLNSFVSTRVDRMMKAGLVEEVREFFDPKADYTIGIKRAIGVPELHEYLKYESLVDLDTQKRLLDLGVKKIKENTEILACRQLKKIQRLYKKWDTCMHRVDATEVFLKGNEEEANEAWENLVLKPSLKIVERFYNEDDECSLENIAAAAAVTQVPLTVAAAYGGGSRVHNMI